MELLNEFVPYSEALELKELGFNEPCFGYYNNKGDLTFNTNNNPVSKDWVWYGNELLPTDMVLAPTLSQLFRWFREKHLLEGLCLPQDRSALSPLPIYFIAIISYKDEKWVELFNSSDDTDIKNFLHYFTYEEAELACLKKLIEIAKIK